MSEFDSLLEPMLYEINAQNYMLDVSNLVSNYPTLEVSVENMNSAEEADRWSEFEEDWSAEGWNEGVETAREVAAMIDQTPCARIAIYVFADPVNKKIVKDFLSRAKRMVGNHEGRVESTHIGNLQIPQKGEEDILSLWGKMIATFE
ncbi:hypothetical protein CO051_06185 [Candidatus Roizmanbacteria bacterium CG_4_9_14_0_2_um_filter_39_13]|uniref:Uncharacterized protein n=1 Tax=Candidatus Roizmanbacteria bacterium CG_4_9_14_0_2_um_filter_39_13 TaxID=1974839 RepID=A0A2M8EWU0_9BACT|nr:MAG: hypothetical protein COY15_02640 [Candidatus Roizmanbacteria bacterium CG_4_10_14_0_2_um_filter_39_12]PJC30332.1 MAG: hypothetical protein CO051_06185 [Candidatus Roizmanbacteria bacterium CG_4_9_14_0_2_um_filter_39_13]